MNIPTLPVYGVYIIQLIRYTSTVITEHSSDADAITTKARLRCSYIEVIKNIISIAEAGISGLD
jgi:hypothetical protein